MGLTKKKPARGENIEVRVLASKGQATGLIVYLSCPLEKKMQKKTSLIVFQCNCFSEPTWRTQKDFQ